MTWCPQEGAATPKAPEGISEGCDCRVFALKPNQATPNLGSTGPALPRLSCRPQRGRGGQGLTLLWVNSLNMAARPSSSTSPSVLMATLRMWMGSSLALCKDRGRFPTGQELTAELLRTGSPTPALEVLWGKGAWRSRGKTEGNPGANSLRNLQFHRRQGPQTSNRSLLGRIQV